MAKPRKRAKQATEWQQFAAVSRDAVRARGGRTARSARTRGAGSRSVAPRATASLAQAAAQAVALGRKQAEWIVEQRKERLAKRAKAVGADKAVARRGGRAGSRGVLVAEGDSWFDYPFFDVLQELDDEFGWDIEHVAHRGDTVESMAYDGGQLDDFVRAIERVVRRGQTPRAILLSGGGNDIAGDGFAMLLNHRSSPVFGLNPAVVQGVLETRIRIAYTTVIAAVTAVCEDLLGARVPILLHGYDYAVPDGRGFLGGFGPLPGPWLEPGFREKGYEDLRERVAIARELTDGFYTMLGSVAAMPAFAHVSVVNLRGSLSTDLGNERYKDWWGNELHPTRDGFRKVAGLVNAKL